MQSPKYCYEIITSDDKQKPREAIKKFARAFIRRSGSLAIIVGMHMDEHDAWYEDDKPIVLKEPFTAEDLGNAISEAMRKTDRRPRNLRGYNLTDWPAFKASGERSVRKFEESFIEISVEGSNAANLAATITGVPEKDSVLQITSTISTGVITAELGNRVLDVYRACLARRL